MKPLRSTPGIWAVLALAAGCGRPPDQTGFVLLAKDNATSRVTVEMAGWQGEPGLPLALDSRQVLKVQGPQGATQIEALPGVLTLYDASTGHATKLTVGVDIAPDRLIVRGSEAAVKRLAESVEAIATPREDGRWTVEGPELFERGSFLEVPPGIDEVAPDFLSFAAPQPNRKSAPITRVLLPGSGVPETPVVPLGLAQRMAAVVGLYRQGDRTLLIDAGGHFTLSAGCGISQRGSYTVDSETNAVILTGSGATLQLTPDGDTLIAANGEPFQPLEDAR